MPMAAIAAAELRYPAGHEAAVQRTQSAGIPVDTVRVGFHQDFRDGIEDVDRHVRMPGGRVPRVLALIMATAVAATASALEKLPYTVVEQHEDMELRQYDTHVVASVALDGDSKEAGDRGFRVLFDYIDGNNGTNTNIPMTAPVLQSREGTRWRVEFVMPGASAVETLPAPAAEDIAMRVVPPMLIAATTYSGNWSRKRYDAHAQKLRAAIDASPYSACGEPVWARYDPPFMPTFLRRNEVLIPVCPRPGS